MHMFFHSPSVMRLTSYHKLSCIQMVCFRVYSIFGLDFFVCQDSISFSKLSIWEVLSSNLQMKQCLYEFFKPDVLICVQPEKEVQSFKGSQHNHINKLRQIYFLRQKEAKYCDVFLRYFSCVSHSFDPVLYVCIFMYN